MESQVEGNASKRRRVDGGDSVLAVGDGRIESAPTGATAAQTGGSTTTASSSASATLTLAPPSGLPNNAGDRRKAAWFPDRCQHYCRNKQRYCRMEKVPGGEFCGVHVHEHSKDAETTRRPCPYDPNHTHTTHSQSSPVHVALSI
eukprot:Opistho-2@80554